MTPPKDELQKSLEDVMKQIEEREALGDHASEFLMDLRATKAGLERRIHKPWK
jgi:hypothetical protein